MQGGESMYARVKRRKKVHAKKRQGDLETERPLNSPR